LHILAPDVWASVKTYLDREAFGYSRRIEGMKFLDTFVDADFGEKPQEGDFEVLTSRLGEFIRGNFTMEEIFEFSSGH
jgi:hypothetical protein